MMLTGLRRGALFIPIFALVLVGSPVGQPASEGLLTSIGEATGWNNARKIVVDSSGTIHLVYQREEDLIAYARSRDGQLWEVGWTREGRWPAIAFDPETGRVHIAFIERSPDGDRLWVLSRPQDEEGNWEEKLIIRGEPRSLFYPALEAYEGELYLAWEEHHELRSAIAYVELPSAGGDSPARAQPQLQVELIQEGTRGLYFPSLAAGPDGVHLVWEQEEALDGRHRLVHAWLAGTSWRLEPVPDISLDARYPMLDYDPSSAIYELVFVGYAPGGNRIFYRCRALTGEGWSEPEELSRGLERGYWSFPVVEDGLVVWGRTVAAGCGTGPLYWSYRDLAGRWSEPRPLEGEFAAFPQLYRQGNVWHLIWTDRDPESPLRRVVRYRRLPARTAPSARSPAGGGSPR